MKPPSSPKKGRSKPLPAKTPKPVPAGPRGPFPIVGIGASAGGLEALELFLSHVPAGSGMALVIVQHLDPTHKGIMPELLQRATDMEVFQVRDRMRVKPDCVYVIPPNKTMSILHGVLHLLPPVAPRGLRLPIDFFFRSLALDCLEHSIGVILSGMGSDGTLGLRAIKEKAGVVLVQDPVTAKFDGMPRSAIDAGLADIVAPVPELPGRILSYLQRTPLLSRPDAVLPDKSQSDLSKAVILLRAHTGHDFSLYKRNTLYRRIERRMGIHQIEKMPFYIRFLQENSQELDLLFKELLIGVTSFFRDAEVWEELRGHALPELLAQRAPGHTLRAWVPGCSTGEEAYSLAITFREVIEALRPGADLSLQIFATDLDRDAIDKARQALFPENIAADVSPERLKRFFSKEKSAYRVRKEIREMVIFAPQDLIMDPPFTKLDVLSCRNLLIYLTAEMQKKLMPLFHYSLNPGGLLLLGNAETIGSFTHLFSALGGRTRLFRKLEAAGGMESVEFPSSFMTTAGAPGARERRIPAPSLQSLADRLVLRRYAPPSVLVNPQGDIFYISGRTGKYLEPAAGKANWNIFAMARDGLREELRAAFQQALRQENPVILSHVEIGNEGMPLSVAVSIQQLLESGQLHGLVMIVFTDLPPRVASAGGRSRKKKSAPTSRQAELERELQAAREEVRTLRDEMQISQEELRSTNEEMQSTNEELQSTNEELTTSKEEMQSLNEELQTVNTQLQLNVDELSLADNDMKNLLNSTDIATLFLDNSLHVRRFTTQAAKIIKLIPGDIGRPITDLASALYYPALPADAREVLRTLVPIEKPIEASDGRWFSVRLMPYRTLDDRIDGAVITFADISVAKTTEAVFNARIAELLKENAALLEVAGRAATKQGQPRAARKSAAVAPRSSAGKPTRGKRSATSDQGSELP